jgi:hypothetical protein
MSVVAAPQAQYNRGYWLDYLWSFDDVPITEGGYYTGSRGGELIITSADAAVAGDYFVQVSNISGSISSSTATLTVV